MKEMVGRVVEEETMESDKGGFSSEILSSTHCHHHHIADGPRFKLKEVSVRLTDCQKKLSSPKKVIVIIRWQL